MFECPRCGEPVNQRSDSRCGNCGFVFDESVKEQTVIRKDSSPAINSVTSGWGGSKLGRDGDIVLYFADSPSPLRVKPGKRLRVGRRDIKANIFPELDLTPFGATDKGVSRIHALLRVNEDEELMIIDQGSTNGTFVNESPLTANVPRILRDGDLVRLGQLSFHIYFKR